MRVAGIATRYSRAVDHQTKDGTRLNDAPATATKATPSHDGPNNVVRTRSRRMSDNANSSTSMRTINHHWYGTISERR